MGRWRQQKRPAIKDQWNHSYKKSDIEMYSTHNEGISVATKRFIRTLKNKIYKYRKIPLIRPIYEHIWGIYGQRTNLMSRYSEGLYSGGKCFNLQSVKLVLFLFSCTKFVFFHISRRWICEICSKLAIKTPEYVTLMIKLTKKTPRRHSWLFIANFEHVPLFLTAIFLLNLIS